MHGAVRILGRAMVGALALVLVLSLLSYHPSDPHLFASGAVAPAIRNWCGGFGALLAGLFHTLVGYGAFLIPCYIVWEVWPVKESRWVRRIAWYALAFALWTTLGAFGRRTWPAVDGLSAMETRIGGWFGDVLWPFFYKGLGPAGYPVLFGALVLVCLVVLAPVLTRALGRLMIRWFGEKAWPWLKPMPARGIRSALGMTKRAFLKAPPPVPELSARDFEGLTAPLPEDDGVEALARAEREAAAFRKSGKPLAPEVGLPAIHSMRLPTPSEELPPIPSTRLFTPDFPVTDDLDLDDVISVPRYETPSVPLPVPAALRDVPPPPPPKPLMVTPRVGRDAEGRRVEQQVLGLTEPTPHAVPAFTPAPRPAAAKPAAVAEALAPVDRLELPPRRLFDPPHAEARLNPTILEETRALVQQKLTEFKVKGSVVGMQPGPVVTVYEFQPDPGVPLAKVMNMEDDLALGLQAEKVRIDRIPGRNLVGIEVPNPKRETITFREIVDSPAFRDPSHKDGQSLLTLALGKDIAGKPVVFDLAKMPHLLIGGSTGSGKSVGVNAMICSILLRAMPDEVKLILVDPKMVEMGIYEDIPHLWAPVVTDMKEAGRVLKWVVAQMEDRYRRLALLSVRNLEGFNQKVEEAGGSIDLSDRTPNPRWPERPLCLEPLPYVVVVIDELADLMMVARAEVEESIARIAQKARAVGIHLVLATQRPSVDIVTGVIKANLPSRLSYRVNTKIDSRTILDTGGGEQLLGKGDALFLAPGQARPHRIHAPFLTEEETLRLVNWLKERGKPDYNRQLLLAMETEEELPGNGGAEDVSGAGEDDVYARACAVVKRERKASTSLLQRKLNLGYGRAARIIDRMEEEGLIGPDRGAGKPREVYAPEE